MINEPTSNTVQGPMQGPRTRTSENPIGGQPLSPRTTSTITDPVRRELGDQTEGAPQDDDPAKIEDQGKVDADAGEGHKGPRGSDDDSGLRKPSAG